MSAFQVLTSLCRALGSQGTFALIGAVARNAWAPPRATTDLDFALVASTAAIEAAERALESLGYRCARRQQIDPADALPDLLIFRSEQEHLRQVDLLVAKTDFEKSVLERAVPVAGQAEESVPVATPEDVLVYKLIAYRERDRADLRAVVEARSRTRGGIDWSYVERWAREWDVEERLADLRRSTQPR